MKISNPLLLTIRNSPLFPKIDCQRVYTTVRKDGTYRVKFYNTVHPIVPLAIWGLLPKLGWKIVSAINDMPRCQRYNSFTIIARPLPKEQSCRPKRNPNPPLAF